MRLAVAGTATLCHSERSEESLHLALAGLAFVAAPLRRMDLRLFRASPENALT